MTHTIYLDILFCVNFVIDYIILLTVKRFLSLSCRQLRLISGAAVGGLSSFVILLPPLPSGVSLCISLISAFLVVGAAFAPIARVVYLKTAAAFFLISFGYCGAMIAVWMLFSPSNVIIRNSSVYIAISPIVLVVTAVICYVILRTVMRITGRGESQNVICRLNFTFRGKQIDISGKIDTGNTLKEPFSGDPVIVVRSSVLKEPPDLLISEENMKTGIRLIPFSSVGGEGLLKAFKCNKLKIIVGKKEYHAGAYIALCEEKLITGGADALVPADLIP